jgi:hypothetical protein
MVMTGMHYSLESLKLTIVAAAAAAATMWAAPALAGTVVANPDTGQAYAGAASKPITNVAANDTVNGAPAKLGASGNATVSKLGTWPTGFTLTVSTGAVGVTAAVAPAVYTFEYQLCDLNSPPDCASTTDTVTILPLVVANPDSGTAVAGTDSTAIANVAANDTVKGAAATLGASGNATIAEVGTWPTGIALNQSTGAVTTTAAVPPGTYSVQYELCDLALPSQCSTATDTVAVTASIVAVADSGNAPAGTASTPIADVAANDTVNGAAAVLGTSGNSTVSEYGTWPSGIALNPATGAITTTPAVPPDIYEVQYQLCDLNTPPDCATTTDTITVTVSIVANPDTGSAVAGLASTPISNVAANDTINGAPATLGASGNATIAPFGTLPAGIALNTATGAVTVTNALALGTYTFEYQLCDLNTPPDCSTTTDTVIVTTASIVPNPDSGTADYGIASQPIANVAVNDIVNGAPAILGSGGNATVAKLGTWPTGLGLNPATGAVSTTVTLPVGVYSFQYNLCDLNSPPDCASTTDTVTVSNSVIVANAQSGTADFGVASQPIANVTATDTVDGVPATLGPSGNSQVGKYGTWPTGIGLNNTTGAVSTTVSVPVGVYPLAYQLCDLNVPANCAQNTATVTVIDAAIVANPQSGTADFGIASQPVANVVATDLVNGLPATLGAGGNSVVTKSGTWPTGIGLNTTTGAVNTTVSLPVGVYAPLYQLCDLNTPKNCATAPVNISVSQSVIVANSQSGTAAFGVASQPIANVVATDTVNGAPVTLGSGGNAQLGKSGTWPTGIGLNNTTGAVSTTVSVPVGVYPVAYKLCDFNVPANCSTAQDTVTVANYSVVANPENGSADYGIASQPIANVAANDTINGAPALLGSGGNARIAKVGAWPTGIGLNTATGAVSTTQTLVDGTYNVSYQLCDLNVPAQCSTTTDGVTVITASILANPQTGSAGAGVASTPIPNTTAGDSVNGAAVTLGSSGNAQIAEVGTWPSGINLNGTTGAVTASAAVAAGTYDIQYELCDRNVPANCANATDEITLTSSVVANPDSGTALAGKASTPIHNVASNDTINGVQARLQTSPNATVAAYGTWPTGISLNTTTGAVTTTASVPPGSYDPQYQLCTLTTPATCATAPITLTVDPALIVLPTAGSAVAGTAATAIGNVAANDIVNGVAAILGASGNATVSQVGTWAAGISLNTTTGAVTTTAAVAAGNYALAYQLCDTNTPQNCAQAPSNVTVTQQFTEVSVSPYMTGDIEFDWARDGIYCAACNYGVGNAQLNWTDRNNNLWVSGVDPTTGMFTPISGHGNSGVPVDTTAFFWQDWGNGPEWAFSTPPGAPGGNPISQLVYTRYQPGEPAEWEYAGAAIATITGASAGSPTWSYGFLPGAYSPPSLNTALPEASQCPSDPVAYVVYEDEKATTQTFTEPVSQAVGTVPTLTGWGALANDIGERWVPCTTWLTFQGDVTIGTNSLQQVFWYDRVSQVYQQLTFDPTTKQRAVMFLAPDFPNSQGNPQYVLMTLAADVEIQIYLQNGSYPNGAPMMELVNTIHSPDPAEPNMFDPKAFIHCSAAFPTCQTYVVMGLSAVPNSQQTESQPNGLGVTNINPNNPMFEILVPAASSPPTQRLDPKFFVTANGPVVYYDRLLALTKTQPYEDQGIYLINMQLGSPFGPCVGSSAEEGLVPGWPNCTAGVPP